MFATRSRTVITTAAALEVGIAGWWLGHGAMWLGAMLAAVTLVDCGLGIVRRRWMADVVGLEMGAVLVAALARSGSALFTAAAAGACTAWLVRPQRQAPLRRQRPAAAADAGDGLSA
jgi:Na+/H+-translocating membrane pyrophosphatase